MNSLFSILFFFSFRKPLFPFNEAPSFDFQILENIEDEKTKSILKVLIAKQENRISNYKELKSDPYFENIDWKRLESVLSDENALEDYAYEFGLSKYSEEISQFISNLVEFSIIRHPMTEEEKEANEAFNEAF